MILFFGDTHAELRHLQYIVDREKPAAIVLLGDIEAQAPLDVVLKDLDTDIYWIHGNHDTDRLSSWENLHSSKLADRNLHGRVMEVDGLRVAGLGGIFREEIWYPNCSADAAPNFDTYADYCDKQLQAARWQAYRHAGGKPGPDVELPPPELKGKALTHLSSIFYETWLDLTGLQADILVCHEAPTCHPHGFAAIDALAREMAVKQVFHGHHHENHVYGRQEGGYEAFGVGLRQCMDLNGKIINAR